MKNKIKDIIERDHRKIKLWFGDNRSLFLFNLSVNLHKCNGTLVIDSSGFTKKEISDMKKYVKDNLSELPFMTYLQHIKIDDNLIYSRPEIKDL